MFTPVWADTKIAQPSASGDWAPGAYDPQSGYLFFTTGVSTRKISPTGRVSIPGTREYGLITALDSRTNKQVWQKEVPYLAGFGSGILATGGGLLFHGGSDGYFRAYDSKTGEELFKPASAPMRQPRPGKRAVSSTSASPPEAAATA